MRAALSAARPHPVARPARPVLRAADCPGAAFCALSARPVLRAASARALRFALCPSAGPRFAAAFLPFVRKTMLFVKKVLKKGLTYGIMAADGRGKI